LNKYNLSWRKPSASKFEVLASALANVKKSPVREETA
jgi:hypothetical protein